MKITRRQLRRIIGEVITLSDKLRVNKSPIHGVGVFAQGDIPTGTNLGPAQIRTDSGSYDITDLGRYHNHSPAPSCTNQMIDDARYLVTSQELAFGDEITIDYRLQPELEQPRPDWR